MPHLLSYIQLEADHKKRPGYFVLTGSQNFLVSQAITQSLAGRVGILTLLPFSIHELKENNLLPEQVSSLMVRGSYPRAYTDPIDTTDLYASYIYTYIERDVRQIINVGNLHTFQKFLTLCAGRIGQLLNMSDLASNCGISVPTATKWLAALEASYILFLLQPHFHNFNKRVIKAPKLYFYDTGIVCNLLGITSANFLTATPFRGHLFENLIISDLAKQFLNKGKKPLLYFWRDKNGRVEVDCIIDHAMQFTPIEIKASETISSSFFDNIRQWNEFSKTDPENNYIIYGGTQNQTRAQGKIITWQKAGDLISTL